MENIIKKVIGDSGIPHPTFGYEPSKPLKIPNLPPARPKGPSDVPAHQAPRADGKSKTELATKRVDFDNKARFWSKFT